MKKKNFVSLMLGTVGVILFGVGMCMCLLPQWQAFGQGIAVGGAGLAVLVVMLLVRRGMEGKPLIRFSARALGTVAFGVVGALALGVGFCMATVWEGLLLPGIAVGVAGILLLVSLIPLCRGLQ